MAAHQEICNEICVYRIICRIMLVYRRVSCHFLNCVTLHIAENIKTNVTCYETTYSSQDTLCVSST